MHKTFLTEEQMENLEYDEWVQAMVGVVGLIKTREIVKSYKDIINGEEIRTKK